MKKALKSFSILAMGILLYGCSKEDLIPAAPTVDFSFSGANQTAPAIVSFTGNSDKATTYFWEFGDGAVSTLMNPSHTYSTGGSYNVKLTVTGASGTNSITKAVTIVKAISKVKITSIAVVAIPSKNGLFSWDSSSDNPDIYLKISDETGATFPKTATIWNLIPTINTAYVYTPPAALVGTSLDTNILKVQVWDDDSDNQIFTSDQKIGEVPFTIHNYITGANKYPSFVSETVNGTQVIIYMTWE